MFNILNESLSSRCVHALPVVLHTSYFYIMHENYKIINVLLCRITRDLLKVTLFIVWTNLDNNWSGVIDDGYLLAVKGG